MQYLFVEIEERVKARGEIAELNELGGLGGGTTRGSAALKDLVHGGHQAADRLLGQQLTTDAVMRRRRRAPIGFVVDAADHGSGFGSRR